MFVRKIKSLLKKTLKGKACVAESYADEFAERCREAFIKHFCTDRDDWRLRMSSLGRPLLQQQCEKLNLPRDDGDGLYEPNDPFQVLRFISGDMTEALLITLLEASGVNIEGEQGELVDNIADHKVTGTYDLKVDGKIYDIKLCSPRSFEKFKKGFSGLQEDDPFGYKMQLALYSKSDDSPPGGWLAMQRVTCELHECKTPRSDAWVNKEYKQAEKVVTTLVNTHSEEDLDKSLPYEKEKFRKKPTGKLLLHSDYNFFPFKQHLWGSKLSYEENKKSKAKFKPKRWYVTSSIVNVEEIE